MCYNPNLARVASTCFAVYKPVLKLPEADMEMQLHLVIAFHRQASVIDLFQLAPFHALARFTTWTGIGLLVFVVYNSLVAALGIAGAPLSVVIVVSALAISVFVIPPLGMRNRLQDEKDRHLSETNEATKATIGRIHGQVNSDTYEKNPGLNTTMSALAAEQDIIQGISTWSWDSDTLRGVVSTLLFPIFLWLVTRLLERLI